MQVTINLERWLGDHLYLFRENITVDIQQLTHPLQQHIIDGQDDYQRFLAILAKGGDLEAILKILGKCSCRSSIEVQLVPGRTSNFWFPNNYRGGTKDLYWKCIKPMKTSDFFTEVTQGKDYETEAALEAAKRVQKDLLLRHYAQITYRGKKMKVAGLSADEPMSFTKLCGRFGNVNLGAMLFSNDTSPATLIKTDNEGTTGERDELAAAKQVAELFRDHMAKERHALFGNTSVGSLPAGAMSKLFDTFARMHGRFHNSGRLNTPFEVDGLVGHAEELLADFNINGTEKSVLIPAHTIVYWPEVKVGDRCYQWHQYDPRLLTTHRYDGSPATYQANEATPARIDVYVKRQNESEQRCGSSKWGYTPALQITADGSMICKQKGLVLLDYLSVLQADYVETRGHVGRAIGRCLQCRKPLSDETSLERGYGAVCYRDMMAFIYELDAIYNTEKTSDVDVFSNMKMNGSPNVQPFLMEQEQHDSTISVKSNDGEIHDLPLRYTTMLQEMRSNCDMTHYEAVDIPFSSRSINMFKRMQANEGGDFKNAHEALNLFDFLHVAKDANRFLDTWSIHSIKAYTAEDFKMYTI